MAALKENGSLALAEIPLDGAAQGNVAASASAIADAVLDASRMAGQIASHLETLRRVSPGRNFDELADQLSPQLDRVATILRSQTGHDFHGYKRDTFLRRVQRRDAGDCRSETSDGLCRSPRQRAGRGPGPVQRPAHRRDAILPRPEGVRSPRREVVPKLFEGKAAGDQVRVWVLGCSTGEEAYSIAILLREHMARHGRISPPIQIFATDIDGRALAAARVGRYSATRSPAACRPGAARPLVRAARATPFASSRNCARCASSPPHSIDQGRAVLAARPDLLPQPPDLSDDARLQDRVIPLFHFSLRPGGHLFLGKSENVSRHAKLFAPARSARIRIFRRAGDARRGSCRTFPSRRPRTAPWQAYAAAASAARRRSGASERAPSASSSAMRPPTSSSTSSYDVLHFSGRTGPLSRPGRRGRRASTSST